MHNGAQWRTCTPRRRRVSCKGATRTFTPPDHQEADLFFLMRILLLFILLGAAAALVAVVLPALRSYLGGDDRRIRDGRTLPAPPDQIERLEERLDQLAAEQQHLADQQQFITKLLQERADRANDPPTDTPRDLPPTPPQ